MARVQKALENLQQRVADALAGMRADCETLGLSPDSLVTIKIDSTALEAILANARSGRQMAEQLLSEEAEESLVRRRAAAKDELVELRSTLDLPNQEYQKYLEAEKIWQTKLNSLLGSVTSPGTVRFFEAKIEALESLPERLAKARSQQFSLAERIFEEKSSIMDVYRTLYSPVQHFIDEHPLARDRFGLKFNVSLAIQGFADRFLQFVNQGRRGTFYGESEGAAVVQGLVSAGDLETSAGLRRFLGQMIRSLKFDRRTEEAKPVSISGQVKDPTRLYDFLFGLDYLEPRFMLRWENKPLEQLSPGERGTLLLVFFLLVDDSDAPLVIDQPEGNLDNQTVFELLVDCVKEARKRRQIIVVTHNPNLAVVCDAEQIIRATLDKESGCRIEYLSGALESPLICKAIVDVLEGTRPAIENRVKKYRLLFDLDGAPVALS